MITHSNFVRLLRTVPRLGEKKCPLVSSMPVNIIHDVDSIDSREREWNAAVLITVFFFFIRKKIERRIFRNFRFFPIRFRETLLISSHTVPVNTARFVVWIRLLYLRPRVTHVRGVFAPEVRSRTRVETSRKRVIRWFCAPAS